MFIGSVYILRIVLGVAARIIPGWLWGVMGVLAAALWLGRRVARFRPIRVHSTVSSVPSSKSPPAQVVIDTEGEVVSQRRA